MGWKCSRACVRVINRRGKAILGILGRLLLRKGVLVGLRSPVHPFSITITIRAFHRIDVEQTTAHVSPAAQPGRTGLNINCCGSFVLSPPSPPPGAPPSPSPSPPPLGPETPNPSPQTPPTASEWAVTRAQRAPREEGRARDAANSTEGFLPQAPLCSDRPTADTVVGAEPHCQLPAPASLVNDGVRGLGLGLGPDWWPCLLSRGGRGWRDGRVESRLGAAGGCRGKGKSTDRLGGGRLLCHPAALANFMT